MKKWIGILVLLVGLGIVTQHLRAYALNPGHWNATSVTYKINPSNLYVSNADAIAAIQQAAAVWKNQSSANISLVYGGTTTQTVAQNDGTNNIMFSNTTSGSSGAITYTWWDGNGYLLDADTIFFEGAYTFWYATGCTGNGEYIEDLGTHEFGHFMGLAHSDVASATMYPFNNYCDVSWETLDPDDIAGIQSIYPPTSNPLVLTCPASASGTSVSGSPVAVTWATPSISGGSTPYGTPTCSPASGTSFAVGTTSVACSVTDATSRTGTCGFNVTVTGPITPPPPSLPAVPSSPNPHNATKNVSRNADLSWTDSGATSYNVYFGTTNPPPPVGITAVASWTLPALATNTTYYWNIVASNSVGSVTSSTWSFKTGKR